MNSSFSFQQISRTGNLDANLITRQYKLNLMADFMRIKYENLEMKKSEKTNQLNLSSSTLQRYRNDINKLSPYRIQPSNNNKRIKNDKNTKFDNNSHCDPGPKKPQMTSNDLKIPQSTSSENGKSPKNKKKNIVKAGSVHDNVEINEHYLNEILHNNSK